MNGTRCRKSVQEDTSVNLEMNICAAISHEIMPPRETPMRLSPGWMPLSAIS